MSKSNEDKVTTETPKIKWDDNRLKTTYANVCNVTSTREEVTLLFGTNQGWHAGHKELTVELSDRIILNPYAAKRLLVLLSNVVGQYEQNFGTLNISPGPVPASIDKT